jgi:hypothetical protein
LQYQSRPFITVNNAALGHSVLYRWSDICPPEREPTPDWWALQNRFSIREIFR